MEYGDASLQVAGGGPGWQVAVITLIKPFIFKMRSKNFFN